MSGIRRPERVGEPTQVGAVHLGDAPLIEDVRAGTYQEALSQSTMPPALITTLYGPDANLNYVQDASDKTPSFINLQKGEIIDFTFNDFNNDIRIALDGPFSDIINININSGGASLKFGNTSYNIIHSRGRLFQIGPNDNVLLGIEFSPVNQFGQLRIRFTPQVDNIRLTTNNFGFNQRSST